MPTDETKNGTKKARQLESYRVDDANQFLTTDNGLLLTNTDDSLKAGERGPTLLEDFHFREKITHFDHERIPERVVHARGFGAHVPVAEHDAPHARLRRARILPAV